MTTGPRWQDVLLLALLALGCSAERDDGAAPPPEAAAAPPPAVERAPFVPAPADGLGADLSGPPEEAGGRIYARLECAGCHESAAVPGLIVTPLQDLDLRYDGDKLTAFLAAPPPPMPRFELSEDERRVVAAYLLSRFSSPK